MFLLLVPPSFALSGLRAQEHPEPMWHVFRDEVTLAELLDAYAAAQSIPLEYDPAVGQAKVTLRSGPGIGNEGLWALLNRTLREHDLACIQAPGEEGLGIVPIARAADLARIEPGDPAAARAGFIKVLRPLGGKAGEGASQVLVHVLSGPGAIVQAIPESGQVLLAGPKHEVLQALAVLESIESASVPVRVEEVSLKHASPTSIVKLVERIRQAMAAVQEEPLRGTLLADALTGAVLVVAPEDELPYWRETIDRFDRPDPVVTREYTPRRFGLDETAQLIENVVRDASWRTGPESWRLVRDSLTGTILLTAPAPQQAEVARLMERIEATPPDALRTMRSFSVRHRDVDQVLGLLREAIGGDAGVPGLGGMEGDGSGAASPVREGGTGGPVRTEATRLTLTKDSGTNRIVAIGPPRTVDEIGRLIESLDVRQPQVLVEAVIVTLTSSESLAVAAELEKLGAWNGSLLRASTLFGAGSPGANATSIPPASGTGLSTAVLDPGSFSGVLQALETVARGRTQNTPKLLVNNHETATLGSVLQTPFASTNASTTVATTSLGGTSDAGTQVTVTPQITDGDLLLIDYEVSLSSFVGSASDATLPPPRQENRIASVATVPDGYTVVVGGLEVEEETESVSRVPILGDLPLLGVLFRSKSTSRTKSRFFVFLRCSVFRDPGFEDLRYLSEADLGAADLPGDAPVVEPRLIR
ncbi:MAG TPA: hypothetical protein ENJ09_03935 [Planctomycetes bacterium]|nr:hypothetical protein [Planctomycetota bacterium]